MIKLKQPGKECVRWDFVSSKCSLVSNKLSTKKMCNEFTGKFPSTLGLFEVL